jgi:hypothetical protein
MIIEIIAEPPARTPPQRTRQKYGALIAAIESAGQWVRVQLTDVTGKDAATKRMNLIQALRADGVRVHTRLDADYVYVCRQSTDKGAL